MKNHLMSLAVCLACFWSSYGSAGYLKDQLLKYCKEYMVSLLRKDSQDFSYEIDPINRLEGWNPLSEKIVSFSTCRVKHKEKTKEYKVRMAIHSAVPQSERLKKLAYKTAISKHREDHIIPVGVVEFNYNPPLGDSYEVIGYIAIYHVCSPGRGYLICSIANPGTFYY